MILFNRANQPINDWRSWTPPKQNTQWRAGRSAMELARAWFTSPRAVVPAEIAALLETHVLTKGAVLREGWPEHVTPLPIRGEGRNHDMVVVGDAQGIPLLLGIEGKVDETLGPTVGSYWRKSKESRKSRAWERTDLLLAAMFGSNATAVEQPWSGLAYQLLTAAVGTAIEAKRRKCSLAVLCVHEFITECANPKLLEKNAAAFRRLLEALGQPNPTTGHLYGPFKVVLPRTNDSSIPLLIGKVQYRWDTR